MNSTTPPAKRTAYIGLGSNLPSKYGSPQETLCAAIGQLNDMGKIVALSSFYETDPVGRRDQPVFLNAVLALETQLDAEELLKEMLALERKFGRDRDASRPKAPRTLDLDLLLVDDLVIAADRLTIPHPALSHRRFVLVPLCEIAPHLRPPLLHHTVAELLAQLPDEGDNRIRSVRRVEASRPLQMGKTLRRP